MSKPRLRDGKALIMGNAYDLKKTVGALHRLVCAYMDATGIKDAIVATKLPDVPAARLPTPGFDIAEHVWGNIEREYDVVDEPLIYAVGSVTFKAYLLGKTWSIYLPESGAIVLPDGTPAEEIDNTPIICVYGAQSSDGSCGLLPPATMDAVERALQPLGLSLERVNCNPQELHAIIDKTHIGFISLPHAVYGAGRKELVVRCVLEDGGEITSVVANKLN